MKTHNITAYLYIPAFHLMLELDRTPKGNFHLAEAPPDLPLSGPAAACWLEDLNLFLNAGICSGCPQGLAFEVRISSMPDIDPILMQQFALSVLDRLDADAEWNDETLDAIGLIAIQLGLAHKDPDSGRFRTGPLCKGDRGDG